MRHTAETLEVELETLYKSIGWPLYRLYGHAFEAFKLMITDEDTVVKKLETHHGGSIPDFTSNSLVSTQSKIKKCIPDTLNEKNTTSVCHVLPPRQSEVCDHVNVHWG